MSKKFRREWKRFFTNENAAEIGRLGGKISKGGGRPAKWTPERLAELHALRGQGAKMKNLAQQFGISESRISRLLRLCPECAGQPTYSERWDALFCAVCAGWLEQPCHKSKPAGFDELPPSEQLEICAFRCWDRPARPE